MENGHRHVTRFFWPVQEHQISSLLLALLYTLYLRFTLLLYLHLHTIRYTLPAMYSSCPLAHLHTIKSPCKLCQAQHQARQNPSLPLERFRCSMCKCFRSITDYPLRDDYRAFTCRMCRERDRDSYRKQKGEPVSQARRAQ